MTDNHPITPPPELIAKWAGSMCGYYEAARWGADQQLEECCEQLKSIPSPLGIPFGEMASNALRNTCRPKPPSLKEQALAVLEDVRAIDATHYNILRNALEQLDD